MARQYPTLRAIDAYSTPAFLAPRVAKIHGLPLPFAEGLVREAKRMLYLCVRSGKAVAPSRRVDLAWHEMMVFTRWYKEYAAFIGGFIHHDPTPPQSLRAYLKEPYESFSLRDDDIKKKESKVYRATKRNYKKYFGRTPDPRYWP